MARLNRPDIKFRNAKPLERPYKLSDELGMYLLVTPSGGRYWRFKYRVGGTEKLMALGVYPEVPLETARTRRDVARGQLAHGIDPMVAKLEESNAEHAADLEVAVKAANSFENIAREWHEKFSPAWSATHGIKLMRRLELHVFPCFGSKAIADLKPSDVLAAMRKPEARDELETAHGIRVVVGQICRYAVATGRASNDPTPALRGAIKANKNTHMGAATTPKHAAVLMRAIDGYEGSFSVRAALMLAALTFQRPGNIRMMEWSELDLGTATWTIPSAKMKRVKQDKENGLPHIVPLSTQACKILEELMPFTGHSQYCFPGERTVIRPISDNTLNAALRTLGFAKEEATAHGFRAMARTLLDEVLEAPVHIIEAQLAHKVRDLLGTAYNRTSHIAQRRKMMQQWADYLDNLKLGAAVPLPRETA